MSAPGRLIAAGLFGATVVSWCRFGLAGTLAPAELPAAQEAALGAGLALALGTAGLAYLFVLARPQQPLGRPHLRLAAVLHLCALPALPLTSGDVFPNLAYGRLLTLGRNPALHTPRELGPADPLLALVDEEWRDAPSVYGPVVGVLAAGCARLPGTWAPLLAFKLLMAAAVWGTILIAFRLARGDGPGGDARGFALLGWNPLLAWEVTGQAHNDGLLVLFSMAFVAAARRDRPWLALGALVLGFCAKFAAAPALLLYLVLQWRRSPARAARLALATVAAVALLYWPFWEGPRTLAGPRFAFLPSPDHLVNSFAAAVRYAARVLLPDAAGLAFLAWTLPAWAGLTWYAWRAAAGARTLEAVIDGALSFTIAFQAIGQGWFEPWYATWLLPLAAGSASASLRAMAALYSVSVPLLYHPGELWGLAIFGTHGVALWLLWRSGRTAAAPQRTAA